MISKNSLKLKLLFLFLIPFPLFSWWDTGHMAVAQIAYKRLQPGVKQEVDRLISFHASDYPACATFITASCFVDDLQEESRLFSKWHFTSIPYNPEQVHVNPPPSNGELTQAIGNSLKTLKNPRASAWIKHLSLCVVIHMVGDLHQPLHCIEFYSPQFPNGDKGGTCFPLQKWRSLHMFWDSMCGLGEKKLKRPLTSGGREELDVLVAQIEADYPEDLFSLGKNLSLWCNESHSYAYSVYKGIQPYDKPSPEYTAQGQEICKMRVAAAGYRLAALLNNTLKDSSSLSRP